jgi:hypothetical protein
MSDKDNVIYLYEPENEGDFISGIPVRDLTQEDIDRLSPVELRELFGAKTYTKANKDGSKPKRAKAKAKDVPQEPKDISVPVVEDTGHGLEVTGSEAVSPNEEPAKEPAD